jgi:hypothetical protein
VRRSRDVWIGAALLAIAAAGIGLLVQSPNTPGPPYRLAGRGPLGLSGLGAGLRDAGFGVDERVSPTIPGHGLIVSVEPRAFSHDEATAWVRSIRAGAVLLLASDHRNPLTEALGLHFGGASDTRPTAAGSRAFPGLSADGIEATATFSRLPRGAVPLIGSRGAAAVALVPVGRGSVFAVSQPRLLTNAGVAHDGLAIALPLAEASGRGAVGVDAFHQGGSPTLGSLAFLPQWVQLLTVEIALIAILAAVAAARRLGPVAPEQGGTTRTTVELVRSLAGMHRSAGRLAAATGPLGHAYRARLGGLSAPAEDALAQLESAASPGVAVRACVRIEEITREVTGGDR